LHSSSFTIDSYLPTELSEYPYPYYWKKRVQRARNASTTINPIHIWLVVFIFPALNYSPVYFGVERTNFDLVKG